MPKNLKIQNQFTQRNKRHHVTSYQTKILPKQNHAKSYFSMQNIVNQSKLKIKIENKTEA